MTPSGRSTGGKGDNWPLLFQKICEKYNKTPLEIEVLTLDQIYIMAATVEALQQFSTQDYEIGELQAAGVIPQTKPGEPRSLAQRIRQQNFEDAERMKKMNKRERRRHEQKMLAEARARGEA